MKPAWSGRNFTPTSIEPESAFDATTGVAELGQMVHGQFAGPGVLVAVGVAVGGPGVGVFVGVGVLAGGGVGVLVGTVAVVLNTTST